MNALFVILGAVVACSATHVKREVVVAPAYYTAGSLYSSQYVATAPFVSSPYVAAPVVSSQYVASGPVVSSAYVAAPNPVLARASRVLGEPGFVSRYVAAPVIAAPARYAVAAAPVDAVETIVSPAKLVAPAPSVAAVNTVAAPAKYTLVV